MGRLASRALYEHINTSSISCACFDPAAIRSSYLTGCLSTKIWRLSIQLHRSSKFVDLGTISLSFVWVREIATQKGLAPGSRAGFRPTRAMTSSWHGAGSNFRLSALSASLCRRHATCSFKAPHASFPASGRSGRKEAFIHSRGDLWDLACLMSVRFGL